MKSITSTTLTASAQITTGPSLLHGIMVAGITAARTHYIKDPDSGGSTAITLYVNTSDQVWIEFPFPIAFPNGFYLTHGGNHTITILYS
ncbi:MAG: hypothetical protein JW726_15080 [Anaerolineales bacterium]|nr:hypothetical protein [Anaerolineales bacterium]